MLENIKIKIEHPTEELDQEPPEKKLNYRHRNLQ